MKRTFVSTCLAGAIVALWFAGVSSRLAAEPISSTEAPAAPATATQPQEITDAIAAFKNNDLPGALKLLREAVKKNPDMPPAELIMAQLCQNIPGGTRAYLEQAAVTAPTDPETYVLMGDFALRERRVTEAELLYQKAASLMPAFKSSAKRKAILQPRIFNGLATVAEARGDYALAQSRLEEWLKIDPKNSVALRSLARCLFQQKNPQGALEKLRAARNADAEVLTPEAILATYYQMSGDKENAKKYMDEAVAANPKDLKTRLTASQWGLETGQLDYAATEASAALQIDSKSLQAKVLAGVIALFQKNYPRAEQYFKAALDQSPSNFAASNNLALALVEQMDETKKRRALEYAENNYKQFANKGDPNAAEAASTCGWVNYKLGRLDQAEKAYKVAIATGQVSPDTAYYIARLASDRGQDETAKQWLDNAMKATGPFAMKDEAEALRKQLKK